MQHLDWLNKWSPAGACPTVRCIGGGRLPKALPSEEIGAPDFIEHLLSIPKGGPEDLFALGSRPGMVMYLLDTNVVSALRHPDRNPAPTSWLKGQRASDVYISVVTFGEIERGIAQQIPRNPDFARDLAQWFERTLSMVCGPHSTVDVLRRDAGAAFPPTSDTRA